MSQPYASPPNQQAIPMPRQSPRNGLGTTALVLGLLGLLFSFVPLIGVIAWPLAILGLIFGLIGLSRARSGVADNKGVAVAGVVLSAVAIVISILWTVVFGVAVSNTEAPGTDISAGIEQVDPAQEGQAAPTQDAQAAPVGQAVRDGKFEFTVDEITRAKAVGNDIVGATAQGEYVILHLTVRNVGTEAQLLSDVNQYLYDARGNKYSADSEANLYLSTEPNNSVWLQEINPGNTVTGRMAFDLPAGVEPVSAELHDSSLSGGVTVRLK